MPWGGLGGVLAGDAEGVGGEGGSGEVEEAGIAPAVEAGEAGDAFSGLGSGEADFCGGAGFGN